MKGEGLDAHEDRGGAECEETGSRAGHGRTRTMRVRAKTERVAVEVCCVIGAVVPVHVHTCAGAMWVVAPTTLCCVMVTCCVMRRPAFHAAAAIDPAAALSGEGVWTGERKVYIDGRKPENAVQRGR